MMITTFYIPKNKSRFDCAVNAPRRASKIVYKYQDEKDRIRDEQLIESINKLID